MTNTRCLWICSLLWAHMGAINAHAADPWAHPISADHPGFSDASATVGQGEIQAEVGAEFGFADPTTGTLGLLLRFGVVNNWEARAEIPSLLLPMSDSQNTAVDSVELGTKWRFFSNKNISLAALPSILIPTGSKDATVQGVSGSLSIIADVVLAPKVTLTASATPRVLQIQNPDSEDATDAQLEASFALGVGVALTRELGLYIESWGTVAHAKNTTTTTPAGDLVLTYLLTPNMMLDLYGGAQFGDVLTPYAGVGYSIRF